jgi:hypothetical protein
MKLVKSKLVVIIILVLVSSLHAGSFYSSKGIGLVRYFVSGRSVGMGGVGLALLDKLTVNYLNPATLVAIPITQISGNFLHEAVDLSGPSQDGFISNTNVAGFQFVIPLKRNKMAISLGLNQFSSIEYAFTSSGSLGSKSFTETISGDGGVNTGFFSFSIAPTQKLSLGITGLLYFGRLRNFWTVDFDSEKLADTKDEVSRSFTAGNFRLGLLYSISKNWNIAGVFTPPVTLDANKDVSARFGRFTDFQDTDIEIPLAFGVGTAFKLGGKLLTGLDFYFQKWSDFGKDGVVNDSKRVAFGVEYFANGGRDDSYFSRVAYRAGLFYRDLGIEDPTGEKVTELFGSIGLGLPMKWRAARIDLALEGGRRGSLSANPIRESIIRVSGTVTIGERWFYRGGRK